MEIFVSEEEIPNNCANCKQFNNYTCGLDKEDKNMKFMTQAPVKRNEYCPIKSIEQHDKGLLQEFTDELVNIMKTNGWEFCEIRDVTSPHVPNTKYTWFDWMLFKNTLDNLIKERGETT